MINKKGAQISAVIGLIIVIVFAAVAITFIYKTKEEAFECNLNKEAVNSWVVQAGLKRETTLGFIPQKYPDVSNLCDPFKVNSLDDFSRQGNNPPRLHKALADTIVDCWNAFGKGEIDFITNLKIKESFCFPCRAFLFSEDIKSSGTKIQGLNEFLKTTKPYAGTNAPTYAQLLSNKNPNLFQQQVGRDEIDITNDLYIVFYTANSVTWEKVTGVAVGGVVTGGILGSFVPGIGNIVGGIMGGVGALKAYLSIAENFNPMIVIDSPEKMTELCTK